MNGKVFLYVNRLDRYLLWVPNIRAITAMLTRIVGDPSLLTLPSTSSHPISSRTTKYTAHKTRNLILRKFLDRRDCPRSSDRAPDKYY